MSENKEPAIGDEAAMREAAESALIVVRGIIDGTLSRRNQSVFDCRDKLKSALARPPRNCDVGTAEERYRRFREYCGCRCLTKCKVYEKGIALGIVNENNYHKADCRFVWAQMPYEEGGAK